VESLIEDIRLADPKFAQPQIIYGLSDWNKKAVAKDSPPSKEEETYFKSDPEDIEEEIPTFTIAERTETIGIDSVYQFELAERLYLVIMKCPEAKCTAEIPEYNDKESMKLHIELTLQFK
jgi:hypothetical protein